MILTQLTLNLNILDFLVKLESKMIECSHYYVKFNSLNFLYNNPAPKYKTD